jgi:hypothetical protein
MEPTITSGDALAVQSSGKKLKIGEIYLFESDDQRLYAHRLLRIQKGNEEIRYIFKGDDLTLPDLPVCASKVLGRVTAVYRRGGPLVYRIPLCIPGLRFFFLSFHWLRPWIKVVARKHSLYYISKGAAIPKSERPAFKTWVVQWVSARRARRVASSCAKTRCVRSFLPQAW